MVFDKPEMIFRIPTENSSVTHKVSITYSNGSTKEVEVVPSAGFYNYVSQLWPGAQLQLIAFFLEQEQNRMHLGMTVPRDQGTDLVWLWYYTKSNLPEWVKQ